MLDVEVERGPKARTRRLMLETASRLMQDGVTPSVTEAAEAAGVSRATAYRYFPSQAALVQAVVDEGLGPILNWTSSSEDAEQRVDDLLASSLPRIDAYEATFKAALKLSLDQWARRQAGTLGDEVRVKRGHRKELLREALSPLRGYALAGAVRSPCTGVVAGLWCRGDDRDEGHMGIGQRRNTVGCTVDRRRFDKGFVWARRRKEGTPNVYLVRPVGAEESGYAFVTVFDIRMSARKSHLNE